ncbi:phage major capsid protein [Oscillospiraceae bacterium NSJ-54]|uniref:Phage major capsid protein n=2 Tax=Zongyangia hominis TaxID=2763677 RepID=A0A926I6Y7_9FIRM|nr:phage major capsid protein [Zongyangia hominis]
MYATASKSFSRILEELDPSENYKGSELVGLDAYQRQLKRFDIKVAGEGSDTVDKFFKEPAGAVLFPEYIVRAVRQGMDESSILSNIIATKTVIDTMDYRGVTSENEGNAVKEVGEGAQIPQTVLKLKDNLIRLIKRGRMLCASYEAVRHQKLDLFTVALRQMGATMAKSQLSDAVDVLMNGDGNRNGAKKLTTAAAGEVTYADLVALWNEFEDYQMNTLLVSPDVMAKLLLLPEFQDTGAGDIFNATGMLKTPMGAMLYKSTCVPAGTIIALDRRYALEMVCASDVQIDYDKVIDRQLDRAAVTAITGFSKIFPDAVRVMTVKTA